MFTGIIEEMGQIVDLNREGGNLRIRVKSNLTNELKIDQSLAHNGVCLTVVAIEEKEYEVVAVDETLKCSNFSKLVKGEAINLERCMKMNGRLDGHIVQGHVDTKARLIKKEDLNGSWLFRFQLQEPSLLIVEKGSICVNGVSLTAFDIEDDAFSLAIIPYTYENTVFHQFTLGQEVNIEFDVLGKYVARMQKA